MACSFSNEKLCFLLFFFSFFRVWFPNVIHLNNFSVNSAGIMEISLLKVLSDAISSFLDLSFSEKMKLEPVSKCYQKAEKMLKLLKPIVDTNVFSDIASHEVDRKLFEELGVAVDELRELILNWHPLSSKIYFVSLVMSLYYNQGFSLHYSLCCFTQCLDKALLCTRCSPKF